MLTVPDEAALRRWCDRLSDCNIRFQAFREADMGDQLTALATEPITGYDRRLFEGLPLLDLRRAA